MGIWGGGERGRCVKKKRLRGCKRNIPRMEVKKCKVIIDVKDKEQVEWYKEFTRD